VRKIVALSDISDPQAVARAMEDAFAYEAFSSEYIANLLEQRARFTPEASALHLTHREDLLEVRLEPPALSLSHATPYPEPPHTSEPALMSASHTPQQSTPSLLDMDHHLTYLTLPVIAAQ
jgi:hypothetical protein